MANVTLSIDDTLLKKSRQYAQSHGTTLNNRIRETLKQTVEHSQYEARLEKCLEIAENAKGNSQSIKWKRKDLYDA